MVENGNVDHKTGFGQLAFYSSEIICAGIVGREYFWENGYLTNIRFTFEEGAKKRFIQVMAITIPPGMDYEYQFSRPVRKKYWALLQSFMLE